MGFQKIDKKQMPQVIGLGVASAGMFGYFAFKMIAPTASAAPPPKPAKVADAAPASASGSAASDGTAAPAQADAPPPTPGMRDPFVPTISDKVAPAPPTPAPAAPALPAAKPMRVASLEGVNRHVHGVPVVPSLPSPDAETESSPSPATADRPATGGLPPMPVTAPAAPAAPSWTVTGVLESDSGNVAILRSGETRLFVRPGEIIEGGCRVVSVTRQAVVMRRGGQDYTLPLGGDKTPTKAKTPRVLTTGTGFAALPASEAPSVKANAPSDVPAAQLSALPAPASESVTPAPASPSAPSTDHSPLDAAADPDLLVYHYRVPKDAAELDSDIAQYRQALHAHPRSAPAHAVLGALLCMKKQPDQALIQERAALRGRPVPVLAGYAHMLIGAILDDKKQYTQAIREGRIAVRLRRKSVTSHLVLADALRGLGQLTPALAECRKAVSLDPKDAKAHDDLGVLLAQDGQTEEAIAEFKRAAHLKPADIEYREHLNRALQQKSDDAI